MAVSLRRRWRYSIARAIAIWSDTVSGEPYDPQDSVHFAAYRAAANRLYRAHVPFDVVMDTDLNAFARYRVLVAPQLQLISDATADALLDFTGTVVIIGETARYDEWLNPRSSSPLSTRKLIRLSRADGNLAIRIDTGLLATNASPPVQLGLRRHARGYTLTYCKHGPQSGDRFHG